MHWAPIDAGSGDRQPPHGDLTLRECVRLNGIILRFMLFTDGC